MANHCLLIGINEYPKVEGANLVGCTNDVALIGSLLVERFGFPEDQCIVLRDREATRAAILGAFELLAQKIEKGDVVVCFYAGHGSRLADPHRPGCFVESIVPSDSGRGESPNRDIFDVEIDRWVQHLNATTPFVTLIFDCCHSGSVTRDPFGEATREIPADLRPPARIFDDGLVPEILGRRQVRSGQEKADPAGYVSGSRRAVTLAACRADELANEHCAREHGEAYRHGALTWFLGGILAQAGPGATWRDVFERLAPALTTRYRRQHPQLEGKVDEVLFGVRQIRPGAYLRVTVPARGGVQLAGGGAHGVSRGSLWTIRDRGARGLGDGEEVARVRVESVRAATSEVRPIEGTAAGRIETGQRAFLYRAQLPESGFAMALSVPAARSPEAARLADLVAETGRLRVAGEGETPEILVRFLAPREVVAPGAPCPGLGPLARWTWAAVGRDGRLAVRHRPEPAELEGLVEDLVQLSRYRQLLELDNPDRTSRLRGRVRLVVRDFGEAEDGLIRLAEGEAVDVEVENRHESPVWITVVQFGADGSIELLMPNLDHATYRLDPGRAGIRLEPGEVASVRDYYLRDPDFAPKVSSGLPLQLPDGFPWAAEPGEEADVGFLHLKLFATLRDTDFAFLQQDAVRLEPSHPLQQLALRYHSGKGRRSLALEKAVSEKAVPEEAATSPEMDWATSRVAVSIVRNHHGLSGL